jgi:lysyl-tRNA synthetase class 2
MNDNTLRQERLSKLESLRELGIDPFPVKFERTHEAQIIQDTYQDVTEAEQFEGLDAVRVCGRITALRRMGGAAFMDLRDGSGRIQLYVQKEGLGDQYDVLMNHLDLGDFLGVEGTLFRTRKGELSIEIRTFQILGKALLAPPEKWHGIKDTEIRYRQRYLDLMSSEESREAFRTRSKIVTAMRRFLDDRDFLEVETPVLQPIYGGAAARPFTTHHNKLDTTLYLRISDELYLKRLIVGGYERVYEIGRDFRNEGLSTKHNPEFTMMECYQAYADYEDIMELVEQMVSFVAEQALTSTTIQFEEHEIDLSPPWKRMTLRDAILEKSGIDFMQYPTAEELEAAIKDAGLKVTPQKTWAKWVDELLSEFVEPDLIQPTFLTDYPVALSPLAKKRTDNPELTERFEAFCGGFEIGNAFSELNDPLDQKERFLSEAKMSEQGDKETQPLDEDFITAMEHGMPPTGGLGIGIDRLAILLTNRPSIRDVILFPTLRRKDSEKPASE